MFKNINLNLNLSTIIIIGAIVLFVFGGGMKLYQNKVNKLKNKLETEIKLKDALLDSVRYHVNKENELVAEKLTIQETLKNLQKINGQLTNSQKELLARVKELNKKNAVITAALIENQVTIDSLMHNGQTIVDTTKKTITYKDTYKNGNKEVSYEFVAGNVTPFPINTTPTFLIKSLYFPNKQFVEFHWEKNKRNDYPISFSVSNSNDFFKTVNIESYAIPELKKDVVDPTGWQKIGEFFVRNGNKVIYIGIGGVVGIGGYWYLTK